MIEPQTLRVAARAFLALTVLTAVVAVPLVLDRQLLKASSERDQVRADFGAYRAQAEANTRRAVEAARLAEQQIHNRQTEILNVATQDLAAARSDAAAALTAAGRLRQRAAALAASSRCAPGAAGLAEPGQAASAAGDVFADVLSRAADRARQLADYADAARVAGNACERSYDALTSGTLGTLNAR